MKTFLTTLSGHGVKYRGFVFIYLILSLVSAVSFIAMEVVTGQMGATILTGEFTAVLSLLAIYSGITLVRGLTSGASVRLMGRFGANAIYKIRQNFARFFVRRPYSTIEKTNTGEAQSLYTTDIETTSGALFAGFVQMLSEFIVLGVAMAYMFWLNWFFALVFFAAFPVLTGLQILVSLPIQKRQVEMSQAQADYTAVIGDAFQNTATIIAYGLEDEVEKRAYDSYTLFLEAMKKFLMTLASLVPMGILTSILPLVLIYILAGTSVIEGNMTVAEFLAFTAVGSFAGQWLMMFSQQIGMVQTGIARAKRVNEIILVPETGGESKLDMAKDPNVAVQFTQVDFAYGEDQQVLHQLDLTIHKGEKVAITGESGSGKSTLMKLILGLYQPTAGTVAIGQSPAQMFAYVPQDSYLFPVSVRENITGKTHLTPEETQWLEEVCEATNSLVFIQSLPKGFDEVLAESAENLSGGQKQRIAMARALYTKAEIILFDEATSALDPVTEAEILDTLAKIGKDKTLIMVAHRASATAICERVIVMKEGRISHE